MLSLNLQKFREVSSVVSMLMGEKTEAEKNPLIP